jgi:hypothetical protein
MSIFEAIMLLCFGVAWPFSIYKSYKTKQIAGKSVVFLYIIFAGYIAGIFHKILFSMNFIIALYILNGMMVLCDILLYYRNKRLLNPGLNILNKK